MSWQHIAPLSSCSSHKSAGVEFAVSGQTGRGRGGESIVLLTVRLDLLEKYPVFLKPGDRFKAMLGESEHAGFIRIEAGQDYLIGKSGGPKPSQVLCLRFRKPACVKSAKCKGVAEYDYGDDWLEVTIPKWALLPVPQSAPEAKALAPVVPPALKVGPGKAPFSMAADVKHDVRRGS